MQSTGTSILIVVALVLKDDAQPVTKKEFQQLKSMIEQLLLQKNQPVNVGQSSPINLPPISPDQPEPLFEEVHSNSHENKPPKHLQ